MPFIEDEIATLKKLIKDRVDNYPNLEDLVASGHLIYKSGGHEATDKETHDLIPHYVNVILIQKMETHNSRLQGKAND